MAVLTPGVFTYAEWAARMDPTGKMSGLINLMSQQNAILEDAMAVECTNGNTYTYTQVVGLPTPTRRGYNQGVAPTMASVGKQVTTTAEYADWSVFDDSLARLGGNLAELRAQEDRLHMEGIAQKVASDLFYANRSTDPTAFNGFANIYNTVSTSTSTIANNVIDCGGTGSTNSSIWLITWGPKHIHTLFPNGLPAGLVHRDMGCLPRVDSGGTNEFLAWRTWMQWNIGVAVPDWRYGVRACNIDTTLLNTPNAPNLINILAAMVYKPPVMPAGVAPVQTSDDPRNVTIGRSAIYVNRTIFLALDRQAQNKTNVLLKMDEWDGHPVLTYRGIPIRVVDALTTSETRVV